VPVKIPKWHYLTGALAPLSIIQVSIFDNQNLGPHRHFIAYEVEGDRLIGVFDQSPGWDDVILGLGLPLATDFEQEEETGRS
jgi:hypothetical protein